MRRNILDGVPTSNLVKNLNAEYLGGINSSSFKRLSAYFIDLSDLSQFDENTWYPIIFQTSVNISDFIIDGWIQITGSWSTHLTQKQGSVRLKAFVAGDNSGWAQPFVDVLEINYGSYNVNTAVRDLKNIGRSSYFCIYLRGGASYNVKTGALLNKIVMDSFTSTGETLTPVTQMPPAIERTFIKRSELATLSTNELKALQSKIKEENSSQPSNLQIAEMGGVNPRIIASSRYLLGQEKGGELLHETEFGKPKRHDKKLCLSYRSRSRISFNFRCKRCSSRSERNNRKSAVKYPYQRSSVFIYNRFTVREIPNLPVSWCKLEYQIKNVDSLQNSRFNRWKLERVERSSGLLIYRKEEMS